LSASLSQFQWIALCGEALDVEEGEASAAKSRVATMKQLRAIAKKASRVTDFFMIPDFILKVFGR
jgi:hypothetical protein